MRTEQDNDPAFDAALKTVLDGLLERARTEDQLTPRWRTLWNASEHGVCTLLQLAERDMTAYLLSVADVIRTRYEITNCSDRLWDLISGLPYLMPHLDTLIEKEQGRACCVDKARTVYEQAVVEELNRIRVAEGKCPLQSQQT